MKRDRALQKLLLLQARDGHAPAELSKHSEADQVYNAALLIGDGLAKGEVIQSGSGQYVSAVIGQLTSAGHEFLELDSPSDEPSLQSEFPPELSESLERFRRDYPKPSQCAFVMMRFGVTRAHSSIVQSIRAALGLYGISALRADDKDYHDDLFWNILTYVYGCGFGIAVFERIELEEFNPNIALEVGYMMALRKPVLLLKDRTLRNLTTDLIGKLYKSFDPQDISQTIEPQIQRWLRDKGIIKSEAEEQAEHLAYTDFVTNSYWQSLSRLSGSSLDQLFTALKEGASVEDFVERCFAATERRKAFLEALVKSDDGELFLSHANSVRSRFGSSPWSTYNERRLQGDKS